MLCVFKNVASTNQEILLDDHSATAGTLDYPDFLFARITDAFGKVTTQNKDFDDGWFTSTCDGGRVEEVKPEPGDIITLKPGEQVTRIIPLWELLADCNTTSRIEPMRAGKNTIQLRLLDIYSNKLKIEVLPKEK